MAYEELITKLELEKYKKNNNTVTVSEDENDIIELEGITHCDSYSYDPNKTTYNHTLCTFYSEFDGFIKLTVEGITGGGTYTSNYTLLQFYNGTNIYKSVASDLSVTDGATTLSGYFPVEAGKVYTFKIYHYNYGYLTFNCPFTRAYLQIKINTPIQQPIVFGKYCEAVTS